MSRSGPFSNARAGWVRRALKSGRLAWGPADPSEGLVIGGGTESSESAYGFVDASGLTHFPRFFFDSATGAFRAGTIRKNGTEATAWDKVNRGMGSVAIGMPGGVASGLMALSLGGNATAAGQNAISIGSGASASGANSCAIAGTSSVASGLNSFAFGGTASAANTVAFRGTASANGAMCMGAASRATMMSQFAISVMQFTTGGDAQASLFGYLATTTDATATELTLANNAGVYLTIGATRTYCFDIKIAAHRTDVSGTAAAWPSIKGAITRDSSGNCRLLGTVTGAGTTTLCDAGGSTWSVAVTADSTNNRVAITVTGEAAKTIRWVAHVLMSEVG